MEIESLRLLEQEKQSGVEYSNVYLPQHMPQNLLETSQSILVGDTAGAGTYWGGSRDNPAGRPEGQAKGHGKGKGKGEPPSICLL